MCSITERRAALASLQACGTMLTLLTACCSLLKLQSLDVALSCPSNQKVTCFMRPRSMLSESLSY